MLIFPNAKAKWTDSKSKVIYIDCLIKANDKSNSSRSDDGVYGVPSYKVTLEQLSVTDFGSGDIELFNDSGNSIGSFAILDIEKQNLVGNYKINVELRPHKICRVETSTTYDADGKVETNMVVEKDKRACLYKANRNASKIALENGDAFVYSYEVTLPRECGEYKESDIVRIYDSAGVLVKEGVVQSFSRGVFVSTIWL